MPPLLAMLHAAIGRVITGNDRRSCEAMNSGTWDGVTLVRWPILTELFAATSAEGLVTATAAVTGCETGISSWFVKVGKLSMSIGSGCSRSFVPCVCFSCRPSWANLLIQSSATSTSVPCFWCWASCANLLIQSSATSTSVPCVCFSCWASCANLLIQSSATGSLTDAMTFLESDRRNLLSRGCLAGG